MTDFFLYKLSNALRERQPEFGESVVFDCGFKALELCGEAGELANVIKKVRRFELGAKGGYDPNDPAVRAKLREELGDVVICAVLLADYFGIDLEAAAETKFNATSKKLGMKTFIR